MTDLVLVNPNNRVPSPYAAIEPPLWLGLIAGDRLYTSKVAIVDAEAEGLTIEETVTRVKELNPKEILIVVMGNNPSVSSTPKMPLAEELLKYLDAKVTGLHPMAVKHPKLDLYPVTLSSIPWRLLPMDKYRAHNWHCLDDLDKRSPYGVLYTSLNCPFSCSYCNIHTLYGDRKVRFRPLADIIQELALLVCDYKIRNIKIWDELFCLDTKRVNEICDFIISQGYDLNIWAYARVDTITSRMLSKMKRAGFNWLAYGFESVDAVRKLSNKNIDDAVVKWAIDMTRDAGINIMGNFLFGLPGDTLDSMKATLDMAVRENFEYVNFNVALPYPGSVWYDSLKDKPTDWSSFNQFSPNICADSEVVKFRDEAFTTYFSRPEYLSMIKSKFGGKAEDHIKEMLKWRIRT